MTMRFTFDERCEDGLAAWYTLRRIKQVLEDPEGSGIIIEALGEAAGEDRGARCAPGDGSRTILSLQPHPCHER